MKTENEKRLYTDKLNMLKNALNHIMPDDIKKAYSTLKIVEGGLSDIMGMEVKEWCEELKESVREWKCNDDNEPEWESYRKWLNQICDDDGMPKLFD